MTVEKTTSKIFPCQVIQSKPLATDYHLLTFVTVPGYVFRSGQYVRMFFKDDNGTFERYYSIANAPNAKNHIQFCVQTNDARVKPLLEKLKIGSVQNISEAAGGFKLVDDLRPVLLVAGGSGISPIRSFFFELTGGMTRAPNRPVNLVYGCRAANAIPGKEEFLEYQSHFSNSVKIWLMAEAAAEFPVRQGRVTDALAEAVLPNARAYVCGPPAMIDAVRKSLERLGIGQNSILQDPF